MEMTNAPPAQAHGGRALKGAHLHTNQGMLLKLDSILTLPSSLETILPVLLESGATANFINLATFQKIKIPTIPLKFPLQVKTIAGS